MEYLTNIQEMKENAMNGVWTISDTLAILDELQRLQKLHEWIPVADRLPEIGEIVQWSHPEWDRVKEGYLTGSGRLKVWGGEYARFSKAKWRPLPPQGKED